MFGDLCWSLSAGEVRWELDGVVFTLFVYLRHVCHVMGHFHFLGWLPSEQHANKGGWGGDG